MIEEAIERMERFDEEIKLILFIVFLILLKAGGNNGE